MKQALSDKFSLFRAVTSIDEEDSLDDEADDLEEEKSGSESSDDDERDNELDKLEEFWQSNIDCASGDVVFIDESGENIGGNEPLAATHVATTNKDKAEGDYSEIEVR